jgi:hypothetical protein
MKGIYLAALARLSGATRTLPRQANITMWAS